MRPLDNDKQGANSIANLVPIVQIPSRDDLIALAIHPHLGFNRFSLNVIYCYLQIITEYVNKTYILDKEKKILLFLLYY